MQRFLRTNPGVLLALAIIILGALTGCKAAGRPPAVTRSVPVNPDIVITPNQYRSPITVSVGKRISILRPLDIPEWQTDYDGTLLAPLTPPEKMRAPGPGGWLFQAIAPGESDVVLTSVAPLSRDSGSPPPAVARFVFTINVQK
jgi:hypothetical protein